MERLGTGGEVKRPVTGGEVKRLGTGGEVECQWPAREDSISQGKLCPRLKHSAATHRTVARLSANVRLMTGVEEYSQMSG